jgi:hypothetical protein
LIEPRASLLAGGDSFGKDNMSVVPFAGETFFNKFLLESLILAQDERWRRA